RRRPNSNSGNDDQNFAKQRHPSTPSIPACTQKLTMRDLSQSWSISQFARNRIELNLKTCCEFSRAPTLRGPRFEAWPEAIMRSKPTVESAAKAIFRLHQPRDCRLRTKRERIQLRATPLVFRI